MSPLEDAARAYVDAQLAQAGSDDGGWLAHQLEVDGLWHELVLLSGRCRCEVDPFVDVDSRGWRPA